MTTNEFIEKVQIQFGKLNSAYRELRKLYGFYDTDIWEAFDEIHSSEAEETIERLAVSVNSDYVSGVASIASPYKVQIIRDADSEF